MNNNKKGNNKKTTKNNRKKKKGPDKRVRYCYWRDMLQVLGSHNFLKEDATANLVEVKECLQDSCC